MAIELFKHNQDAYAAAVQMLQTTRKAAVIHPTGTGKAFIAFKLCEDHPEKTICWLSAIFLRRNWKIYARLVAVI